MHSIIELNALQLDALKTIANTLGISSNEETTKQDLIIKIVEKEAGIIIPNDATALTEAPKKRTTKPKVKATEPIQEIVAKTEEIKTVSDKPIENPLAEQITEKKTPAKRPRKTAPPIAIDITENNSSFSENNITNSVIVAKNIY